MAISVSGARIFYYHYYSKEYIAASICFWDISLARNPGQAASYVFHARGRVTRVSHERYVPKAYRRSDILYRCVFMLFGHISVEKHSGRGRGDLGDMSQ